MIIKRSKEQGTETLEEFYRNWNSKLGQSMLCLIARLKEVDDERILWGLTSHARLCLLSDNPSANYRHVIITAGYDDKPYKIECHVPPEQAPWPNAYIHGEAYSLDEAISMILAAMDKSEGWRT